MLTLTGTLRQSAPMSFEDKATGKPKSMLKLWIEHESPRGDGPADLQILELLIPADPAPKLPSPGTPISVDVRAYPKGREIGFSALRVRPVAVDTGNNPKAA